MKKVFLFSGTSEGRELAAWLAENKIQCLVSVATEYGRLVMEENSYVTVLEGRMEHSQMVKLFQREQPICVVDATHPFATKVTQEIQEACRELRIPYYRVSRETGSQTLWRLSEKQGGIQSFSTMAEAAHYLKNKEGNIFLTTGSKQLGDFVQICQNTSRIFARVLPSMESLELCERAGLSGSHVLAMQGPFSTAMNVEMLKQVQAAYLVTKETGQAGGFWEKIEAARIYGCQIVVIENPEKQQEERNMYSVSQMKQALCHLLGCKVQEARELFLIGIGMGTEDTMTLEADRILRQCDLIFGAPRLLEEVSHYGKKRIPLYKRDEILSYLKLHPDDQRVAVVFSGDIGFYSGAAAFFEGLQDAERGEENCWKIKALPGISAVSYFASKLQKSWQNWTLLSAHGRTCDVTVPVREQESCFLLMDDVAEVKTLGQVLESEYGNRIRVSYGYQLSYPEEIVETGEPHMLLEIPETQKGLYVILIENTEKKKPAFLPGMADQEFIRLEQVPMTKEEVRALCLCKLQLTRDSIVYDIGAGTGSVSVECARLCPEGRVYSLERKKEACEAIALNQVKFAVKNLDIIHASAPEGLLSLPTPTHVFIGGTGGHLQEIYQELKQKSLQHEGSLAQKREPIRVVLTAVTLETISEMTRLAEEQQIQVETIQLAISKAKKLGSYHLMQGQNPVTVFLFTI